MNPTSLVLAAGPDLDHLRGLLVDPAPAGTSPVLVILILTVAVLAAALAAWSLLGVLHTRRAESLATWRQLCRGLGLPAGRRRLVLAVARAAGHHHPAALLLSLGCFDHAVARYRATPAQRRELDAVRREVFTAEAA